MHVQDEWWYLCTWGLKKNSQAWLAEQVLDVLQKHGGKNVIFFLDSWGVMRSVSLNNNKVGNGQDWGGHWQLWSWMMWEGLMSLVVAVDKGPTVGLGLNQRRNDAKWWVHDQKWGQVKIGLILKKKKKKIYIYIYIYITLSLRFFWWATELSNCFRACFYFLVVPSKSIWGCIAWTEQKQYKWDVRNKMSSYKKNGK